MSDETANLRELVADVAAAYFSNSHVTPSEIPTVVEKIAASLAAVGAPASPAAEPAAPETVAEPEARKATAAQIRKSITPDALISFEDGKGYKTLKRHLTTRGMSIAEYKDKWGLPKDYPTTAPSYSAARSQMAKTIGLGQKGAASRGGRKPRAAKAKA
jgi:predicted transcriptional regulator